MGGRIGVLCVDDEPNVLEGLTLHLRRRYGVITAGSGAEALQRLAEAPETAVIVSDMRMPGMDGASFLAQARERVPDAVRILLTGQADIGSAIAAINDGQIFRFLTKPCPPTSLLAAVDAAARQYALVHSERVLLEETLRGSIKALTDVLALTNPVSFGRANRLKQLASELAERLALPERWQVEVAAMLSQLGCITLPSDVVERMYYGQSLSESDQRQIARLPSLTEQLLANIPRMEGVRAMLAGHQGPLRRAGVVGTEEELATIARGSQILKVALDYDELETQGTTPSMAVSTLFGRRDRYATEVLEALAVVRGTGDRKEVRELPLSGLRVGMVIAEDLKMTTGALLVARGYEVTPSFLARARLFRAGSVREPVRVILAPRSEEMAG